MIHYQTSTRLADAALAKGMLDNLESFYPNFNDWYINTCMPGIMVGKDKLLVAREHGQIIGVALGKLEGEKKLRCVRVLPAYQQRGIGLHLIDKMLRELDCDKPLCTVSEEMLHQFSRPFINLFKFELSTVDKGKYRPGKLEYVFNAND